jgi:hypothetical protein
MDNAMYIGVKYCGGCNPAIDRGALVFRLQRELAAIAPDVHLWSGSMGHYDAVLLINGCAVGCTEGQFREMEVPLFAVAGEFLDGEKIGEDEMRRRLKGKILRWAAARRRDEIR